MGMASARLGTGAEVHEDGPPAGLAHDVLRLDVAMHESGAVDGRERAADVDADDRRLARAHAPVGIDPLLQRLAFEELHPEADAAVVAVGAVDGNHVGVTNPREQTTLGDHRLLERLGVGVLDAQELERDIPRELRIPRAIHRAVAAAADELPELQRSPAIDGLRIPGPRGVIGAGGSRPFVVAMDVGDGGEDLELTHQLPLVVCGRAFGLTPVDRHAVGDGGREHAKAFVVGHAGVMSRASRASARLTAMRAASVLGLPRAEAISAYV